MFDTAFNLKIDSVALDHMLHAPSGDVRSWLIRKGVEMEKAAQADLAAHGSIKSGRLARSVASVVRRAPFGHLLILSADARRPGSVESYAFYYHNGTRPHVIHDLEGMAFTDSRGKTVTRTVKHPGFRGHRFLSNQLKLLFTP